MAVCSLCGSTILGKKYKTSDLQDVCGFCAASISGLCLDGAKDIKNIDLSKYDIEQLKEMYADILVLSSTLAVSYKNKKIIKDDGLFKKKFIIIDFSDIKEMKYSSTKKGKQQKTNVMKGVATGGVIGAAVDGVSGGIKGGILGARVEGMKKAFEGADFLEITYEHGGKKKLMLFDGSLDQEKFIKICECFEKVHEISGNFAIKTQEEK